MTKKAKAPPPTNPNGTLQVGGEKSDLEKTLAQTALRPSVQGGVTIKAFTKNFGDLNLMELIDQLRKQAGLANTGDLSRPEGMLAVQAHTLDCLFNELARRAGNNLGHYPETADRYMRLALKAQSQCRTTIETLAEIKNPRAVAFVKQANIATNQQVNNGPLPSPELSDQYAHPHAPAREIISEPNKLLEADNGQRLDTGTTSTAGRINSQLEAVGAVNRSTDTCR